MRIPWWWALALGLATDFALIHPAADAAGGKPQEAAQDAASSVKAAVPDEPKQAAQDAVSAAKDSLPEPPKDIPNPFQNLFSGMCERS